MIYLKMLFRTIINSTMILFLYLLIQPPSPKIKIPQNSNVNELKTNFQDGVDSVYNAVVAKGSTPASKSLSDVIEAINNIQVKGNYGIKKLLSYPGYTKFNSIIADRDYIAVIFMFTSPNNGVVWKNNSICSSGTLLENQWFLHDQTGINQTNNYLGVKIYTYVPKGATIAVQMGTVYGVYES